MNRHATRAATVAVLSAQIMLGISACADLAGPAQPTPTTVTYGTAAQVQRVIDGDTIELADGAKVRVLGIDTPELRGAECGAAQAKEMTAALLPAGAEITLTPDATQDNLDRYGRQLRYVTTPAGTDLGHELLAAGWAKVYVYQGRAVTKIEDYQAAESRAGAKGLGIWGNACAAAG